MIHEIYITDYLTKAAIDPATLTQFLLSELPVLVRADWQLSTESATQILLKQLQRSLQGSGGKHAQVASVLASVRTQGELVPAFCLLPVHLNLQRDSYSLQGIVALPQPVFDWLTLQIQRHFYNDFTLFADPDRRFWWVQPHVPLDAICPWPQDYLFQQAFAWQPEGQQASVIRQWMNELQMLLHQFSGQPTVSDWPERLNSLWFASTSNLPDWQHDFESIQGQGDMYNGLNKSGLSCTQSDQSHAINKKVSKALYIADEVSQVDWKYYSEMVSKRQFSSLKIIAPFAERSLCLTLKRKHLWQFWRKPWQVETLFKHLQPQSG